VVVLSVVPAMWPGERLRDVLKVAELADAHAANGVWVSEVNGYDAFAVAALVAHRGRSRLIVGPLAVHLRDPVAAAMGIATVAAAGTGSVVLALGASSPAIVERWHGRDFTHPVEAMRAYVPAVRTLAAGGRGEHDGVGWHTHGFRLSVDGLPALPVWVAALGPRMLRLAGEVADAVVVNLVPTTALPELRAYVEAGAIKAGRQAPPIIVWVAVGSTRYSGDRLRRLLPGYLQAPGYRRRLEAAGVVVDRGLEAVTALGEPAAVRDRVKEYAEAGADEIAVVVSGADPAAAQILAALFQDADALKGKDPR
jgi:probable F420-dependent oxidoreductase